MVVTQVIRLEVQPTKNRSHIQCLAVGKMDLVGRHGTCEVLAAYVSEGERRDLYVRRRVEQMRDHGIRLAVVVSRFSPSLLVARRWW